MNKVYIVAAKRSPIGAFQGSLKGISAGKLGAEVIKAALQAAKLTGEQIDEVIMGNVMSAGQGMGVARQASLYADIPASVPAYGLNMVCGSGMKSVMDAVAHIRCNEADIVVAGGVEVMSQIPFAVHDNIRSGHKMGHTSLDDLLISDGLTDVFNQYHMGMTAENIASRLNITREEQDQFALASQYKATSAIESGKFVDEVVPITVQERRKEVTFSVDEFPKANCALDSLAKLRPAFCEDGTVTAGNASGINDGASVVIVASQQAVDKYQLQPLAEIVSSAQSGIDPTIMGLGPVEAVNSALQKADLPITDISVFELNEAFAAQTLGVVNELARIHQVAAQEILDKTNINGGAIALGHPLGASGNRILVSLIHELRRSSGQYGLASLCVGGGMGTAIVIKSIHN